MSPPPRPPPALLDELVEEALLRVPPDDPASLVRASLVCKLWHRIISGRHFRRRYREFHPSPPMLGFFYHKSPRATRFMPTSTFRLPRGDRANWHAMDARHGRVVFHVPISASCFSGIFTDIRELIVLNLTTGEERRLPMPLGAHFSGTWNAAVVCAADGCDHLDCPSGGPFTIVFVCTHVLERLTSVCTFSSTTGSWSIAVSFEHPKGYVAHRSALVETETEEVWADPFTTEDGRLGIAMFDAPKFHLWSTETGLHGHAEWVQQRVFELDKLPPDGPFGITPLFCGTVDKNCVIFVGTRDGLFTVDLKSGRVRNLLEDHGICDIVPYMSFSTPTSLQANKLLMEDEVRRLIISCYPREPSCESKELWT
ncbi:hypothetical protein QOZ80_7BG0584170 [Eleusine coracana subsp. coracana]|nr:hypothetical protein QOZ80_7BG0584170 [Eleusine coracana subsp. coracana]